jgi:hypothetical protein
MTRKKTTTTDTRKLENTAFGISVKAGDKVTIAGVEVELRPLDFRSELELANQLGHTVKELMAGAPETEMTTLSQAIVGAVSILNRGLDFQWLMALPAMTGIIARFYNKHGYNIPEDIESMTIPQMTAVVLKQIEVDRQSDEFASDFFLRSVKMIPGLAQLTNLMTAVTNLAFILDSRGSTSSAALPENSDNTPAL